MSLGGINNTFTPLCHNTLISEDWTSRRVTIQTHGCTAHDAYVRNLHSQTCILEMLLRNMYLKKELAIHRLMSALQTKWFYQMQKKCKKRTWQIAAFKHPVLYIGNIWEFLLVIHTNKYGFYAFAVTQIGYLIYFYFHALTVF